MASNKIGDDPPHSCKYCEKVILSHGPLQSLSGPGVEWTSLIFDLSLAEFRSAVTAGCLLCMLIQQDEYIPMRLPSDLALAADLLLGSSFPHDYDTIGSWRFVDKQGGSVKFVFTSSCKPLIFASECKRMRFWVIQYDLFLVTVVVATCTGAKKTNQITQRHLLSVPDP